MQNTSEISLYSTWLDQQEAFIASLKLQPLVVVLRPDPSDYEASSTKKPLFLLIEKLHSSGIKHIEISWVSNPYWISLMQSLKESFNDISFGAASITNTDALQAIADLGLDYAMTPVWDPVLQLKAINLKQLLIPGVFSPTEFYQAKSFGCGLVKFFPASLLGIKYANQLKAPLGSLPFIIAAGGLTVNDLTPWLQQGYGALALGRELIHNYQIDPKLQQWLDRQSNL